MCHGSRFESHTAERFPGTLVSRLDLTQLRVEAIRQRRDIWLERLMQPDVQSNPDALLTTALDAAISIALADLGNIQVFDPLRHGLVIVAQRGFSQPFLDFFHFVGGEDTACGVVRHRREPVAVEDITNSPIFTSHRTLEVMLDARVRAVISLPLVDPVGELRGVLSVHYRQPHFFDTAAVAHLVALSNKVAMLMDPKVTRAIPGDGPWENRTSHPQHP